MVYPFSFPGLPGAKPGSGPVGFAPRNETRIVLIDGNHLAELMIDFGLGCTTSQTFEIKKIDNDYFSGD